MSTRSLLLALVGVVVCSVAATLALVWAFGGFATSTTTTIERTTAAASSPVRATPSAGESLADVYARVAPGVVRVETARATQSPVEGSSGAVGSGFAIDDAHIVTNAHVVEGAERVQVEVGGEMRDATIVGVDTATDLALIRVDGAALEPLTLGDPDALRAGDAVFAVGAPFGLDLTLTSGIVSGLAREVSAPDGSTIDSVIQTDAAINPGNSGGPLFDAAGAVVGVNSQIATSGGGNDGIGYAIPADTVKRVVADLRADGTVERGYIGVELAAADASGAAETGVLVGAVTPGGPADAAGMRAGDRITAVDGTEVTDAGALRTAIGDQAPGDTITLTIERDGDEIERELTLTTRPS